MNVLNTIYAKIVGDPASMAILRGMVAAHPDDPRFALYKQIVEAADAETATVAVQPDATLAERRGGVGEYDPVRDEIWYDPKRTPRETQGNIAHELLHFLMTRKMKNSPQAQHEIMKGVLGSDQFQTEEMLKSVPLGDTAPLRPLFSRPPAR